MASLAGCTEGPIEPMPPAGFAVAPAGLLTSSSSASIFLGSGVTVVAGRDPANVIVACTFVRKTGDTKTDPCASVTPPAAAHVVSKHPFWANAASGTAFISPTPNGRTTDHACCTSTTFENKFALPANAVNATITISMIGDNQVIAEIDGVEIGRHATNDGWTNFNGPAVTFTKAFTPHASGNNSLRVILYDGGGAIGLNYAATVTYDLADITPPVITPSESGTMGTLGWYTSDVDVSWSVADAESDISSTSGCGATTMNWDANTTTFTCTATSEGGTASGSVVIKRDASDPVIIFSGNTGSYTADQTVAITCSAADAMSGLASSDCPGASGDAYTFGVGTTTLDASATDNAGNESVASTDFTVSVTSGSLCTLVRRWVDQHGVANAMCKQLSNGAYRAFINHVQAQSGKKWLSASNAAILIDLAGKL